MAAARYAHRGITRFRPPRNSASISASEVCAPAIAEAVQNRRRCSPDVAVVDIKMPPTHTDEGPVAAQRIRDEHPDVAVLVLSQYLEPSYAMRLLERHPQKVGYLLKERVFAAAVLVDALRRVCDGETVVDPTIVSRLFGRRRGDDPLAALSPRTRCLLSSPKGSRTRR